MTPSPCQTARPQRTAGLLRGPAIRTRRVRSPGAVSGIWWSPSISMTTPSVRRPIAPGERWAASS